jgi:hypothetical protein
LPRGFFAAGVDAGGIVGAEVPSDGAYWFSSTTAANGSPDVGLFRDAAGELRLLGETALTNSVNPSLTLRHATSGTPAAGIGAALRFEVETAADNYEVGATIAAVTTDVTSTSEDFDLVFNTMLAGAAADERFRVPGTGLLKHRPGAGNEVHFGSSSNAGFRISNDGSNSDYWFASNVGIGYGLRFRSDSTIAFSSTTNAESGSYDIGFARNAAGVLEINSGTDGTFRDIKARSYLGQGSEAVVTLTDGATPALDASLGKTFKLIAAGNRTIAVPSNAPAAGFTQKIVIVHEASGADRTLALNTGAGGFRFGTDITALTATTSGTMDYIGCIWNQADGFWDVVSYVKGF